MTKPPTGLMAGIDAQLHYLSRRQQVLAQNIANSETPGYKARDMAAPDFSALVAEQGGAGQVARPSVALTAGMAALGARQPLGAGGIQLASDVTETKPDGNNVTLEDQLLKMGEVQTDFAALTNLYRKQLAMLKTALGRGGSG